MNLHDYDFDRLLGLGYTEKATGDLKDACVPIKKSDHAEEMKRKPLIAGPSAGSPSFAEGEDETFDFTRCVRPNGTAYGTAGKCKSGSEEAKPKENGASEKPKAKTRAKKKASPSVIAREESKLATLEKRLAAAEEKVSSARGGVTTARAKAGTRLRTTAQNRAGSAANRAITRAQELQQQVREQKRKINEMKGIKPKAPKAAPRTAKDDRRDKLRKTIDRINERAKQIKAANGSDSPEFKRFVQKYGGTLTKLMDEQHKLIGER
jgi:hypothetical protein